MKIIATCLNSFCGKRSLRRDSFSRRAFVRWLLGVPLLSLCPFQVRETRGQSFSPPRSESKGSIGEFFKGEDLTYEVGFWLLKKVALGRLTFREMAKKGNYQAMLEAETLGVLGWVARYRVDTYRATMEEVDGGRRFKALAFEEDVRIGDKVRRRKHVFDYPKGRWTQWRQRKDGTVQKTEQEIPPGMVYDDFLTASFNFRFGVYGEIRRGKKYTVATFPRKGSNRYEVSVAEKEEEERRKQSYKIKDGKEYFIKLVLDPEITHSKEGLIEGWLSKELYPMEGTIRDVVLFGDVKGTLVQKKRQ